MEPFQWSPGTGLSDAGTGDPEASPANTTTNMVALTDDIGCNSVDTVTVTVHEPPKLSTGPAPWLCLGSNVSLTSPGPDGSYA